VVSDVFEAFAILFFVVGGLTAISFWRSAAANRKIDSVDLTASPLWVFQVVTRFRNPAMPRIPGWKVIFGWQLSRGHELFIGERYVAIIQRAGGRGFSNWEWYFRPDRLSMEWDYAKSRDWIALTGPTLSTGEVVTVMVASYDNGDRSIWSALEYVGVKRQPAENP